MRAVFMNSYIVACIINYLSYFSQSQVAIHMILRFPSTPVKIAIQCYYFVFRDMDAIKEKNDVKGKEISMEYHIKNIILRKSITNVTFDK